MKSQYVWKYKSKAPLLKNQGWLKKILAQNRGLTSPKLLQDFFNPTLEQVLKVQLSEIDKGARRVLSAIKNKEKIAVYSDYDADGICATAIMWETLYDLGANVVPYVPHRITEGYGLSISGIDKLKEQEVKLIITVDHGVTAVEKVAHAAKIGIDTVITDHHVLPSTLPKPYALVHTTDLCGAGVSWRFAWEIVKSQKPDYQEKLQEKLELAALATIADLVPLTSANRAIVKIGLEKLTKSKRPGIIALMKSSGISGNVGTYEIGHVLAPRINAMGRIEHGLDSLRLLCTRDMQKAETLAALLTKTNSRRQDLTTKAIDHAKSMVENSRLIGVISHETWHEGVIGLVASRLVESFWRPMIVIAKGEKFSKGSARSIPGFNIVEAIRASSQYLVDAGGHPMAAGFTIETQHIEVFTESINKYAQKTITEEHLKKRLEIECEIAQVDINRENLNIIKTFAPFGVANPEPLFATREMTVEDARTVGAGSQHLKLQVEGLNAIGFNLGNFRAELRPGYKIDLVYTINEDKYNGNDAIQLKIKDLVIIA